jgi:hypothetical protein
MTREAIVAKKYNHKDTLRCDFRRVCEDFDRNFPKIVVINELREGNDNFSARSVRRFEEFCNEFRTC